MLAPSIFPYRQRATRELWLSTTASPLPAAHLAAGWWPVCLEPRRQQSSAAYEEQARSGEHALSLGRHAGVARHASAVSPSVPIQTFYPIPRARASPCLVTLVTRCRRSSYSCHHRPYHYFYRLRLLSSPPFLHVHHFCFTTCPHIQKVCPSPTRLQSCRFDLPQSANASVSHPYQHLLTRFPSSPIASVIIIPDNPRLAIHHSSAMKTFTAAALASGALFSLASAQEQYQIAPNSVSSSDRSYWCQQQITQCPVSPLVS